MSSKEAQEGQTGGQHNVHAPPSTEPPPDASGGEAGELIARGRNDYSVI